MAYGATLLAVAIGQAGILYMQIGDGDILAVSADGRTIRPLGLDPRLIGNQTTSLCQPEAWREFRIKLVRPDAAPALILLSTDGYANAFESDDAFLKIGRDYLEMIARHGRDRVSAELPHILGEASRLGSGDDVTLGMLYREPVASSFNDRPPEKVAQLPDELQRDLVTAKIKWRKAIRSLVVAMAVGMILLMMWLNGGGMINLVQSLLHQIGGLTAPTTPIESSRIPET